MKQDIYSFRQRIHDQIRRQQIQQKFRKSRKELQLMSKATPQNFYEVLSNLDETNYKQYKELLRMYSYDDNFNFSLLAVVGIVYQYLITNPYDEDSRELLRSVCQYQQIQIPQTEQLAKLLTMWIANTQNIQIRNSGLQIVSVLLKLHRYEQILRDILICSNIITQFDYIINQQIKNKQNLNKLSQQEKFKQNYVVVLIGDILASFLSSVNPLQLQIYQQCTILLSKTCQFHEIKWIVGNMFSEINSKYKQNHSIAQILNQYLSKFVQQNYYSIVEDCVCLFKYSIRSEYPIKQQYFQFMLKTILTDPNASVRKSTLFCILYSINGEQIQPLIKQTHINQLAKDQYFMQKIIQIFIKNHLIRQDSLLILHKVLINETNDSIGRFLFQDDDLVDLIHQCLVSSNNNMVVIGLQILEFMLCSEICESQSRKQRRQNLVQVIKDRLKTDFFDLMSGKNKQICEKIQTIMNLVSE